MDITFHPYRMLGVPHMTYIKPECYLKEKETIQKADTLWFPEYWQIHSLAYGMKKKIFPSLATYHIGHDKVEMTRVFQSVIPQHHPYTEITKNTAYERERILETFPFPFIAKTVRSSMGDGVFYIESKEDFEKYANAHDTLYIQEYLPITKDLRIVWVGDEVIEAYWRISDGSSHLNNVSKGGSISYEDIPHEAIEFVKRVANMLGINHAGFDVAMVDNHPYLFEINVLFGDRGIRGNTYKEALQQIKEKGNAHEMSTM